MVLVTVLLLLRVLVVHDLSWRVAAAVLAKVDLESFVLLLPSDGFNGLDGIGDVGEVHECTALLPQGVDQLDLAVFLEVLSETIFGPAFVEVANVDITRSAAGHCQSNRWRQSPRVLAPSNLEAPIVDHQALEVAERVERSSRCWVDEGDEANMLVRDIADVVKKTATNDVADLFDGGFGVDIP